jgi:hypothetical protein
MLAIAVVGYIKNITMRLTEFRRLQAPSTQHMTTGTIHQSIRLKGDMTNGQIYGGSSLIACLLILNSLGAALFQILTRHDFPTEFTHRTVFDKYNKTEDKLTRDLLRGCFSEASDRPTAQELVQRFLDKYNEECARKNAMHKEIQDALDFGREIIYNKRKGSESSLSFAEGVVNTLLGFEDSWDDEESKLGLAPQVNFTIGAGILWGSINLKFIKVPPIVVSRDTTSTEGIIDIYRTDASSV